MQLFCKSATYKNVEHIQINRHKTAEIISYEPLYYIKQTLRDAMRGNMLKSAFYRVNQTYL